MRQRCENPVSAGYHSYGGRGITVCARWQTFESFLVDMGPRPSLRYSIERINNDGNYEPGNCRWATATEQANNTSASRRLTHDGHTMTVAQWARHLGMPHEMIRGRLKLRWPMPDVLNPNPQWCPVDVTFRGETKTLSEWARAFGYPPNIVFTRYYAGWPIDRILTEPERPDYRSRRGADGVVWQTTQGRLRDMTLGGPAVYAISPDGRYQVIAERNGPIKKHAYAFRVRDTTNGEERPVATDAARALRETAKTAAEWSRAVPDCGARGYALPVKPSDGQVVLRLSLEGSVVKAKLYNKKPPSAAVSIRRLTAPPKAGDVFYALLDGESMPCLFRCVGVNDTEGVTHVVARIAA